MALVPLDIPAGVYKNGTELEATGRWSDGSLVRWQGGSLRPVNGWEVRQDDSTPTSNDVDISTNPPRGMHAWEDQSGTIYIAAGTYNELNVALASGVVYDITPGSGLTSGINHSSVSNGYGTQFYGRAAYGDARPSTGVRSEATTWSLDNWGQYLVGCSCMVDGYGDGRLLQWQLNTAYGSELISNGNFSTYPDTDWIVNTGWSIPGSGQSGNTAVFSSSYSTPTNLEQNSISMTAGKKYRLVFTVYNMTTSNTLNVKVGINLGLGSEQLFLEKDVYNGTHTFDFACLTTSSAVQIRFIRNTTGSDAFNIDNVSIKETPQSEVITNAPTNNFGLVVTEERFLFALGAGGNPRLVQWADRESLTDWTVSVTNEAGFIELSTNGQIMQGLRTRGQTLILTDTDAHAFRYIGPPYVYSVSRVGTSCGTISRKAAVDTSAGTFWMGPKGFFVFNGNTVTELPCEVFDHVFNDILVSQQSKVWAWDNSQFGEVWWFYQSEAQDATGEIDKYVSYSYKENYWSIGSLSRTAGISRGLFQFPILADGTGLLYNHEKVGTGVTGAFAESGPIQIGQGDNIVHVTSVIPDEASQGGVSLKFKTRFYPNAAETTHGPYSTASPTDVRFAGRQIKMRCDGADGADFKVGIMRLETVPGGRR